MNKKLLRKKLALMLATLKKKRPFYCELEYLESTGTQYIDTGLFVGQGYGCHIKLYPTKQGYTSSVMGGGESNGTNEYLVYCYSYNAYIRNGTSNSVNTSAAIVSSDVKLQGIEIQHQGDSVIWKFANGYTSTETFASNKWSVVDSPYKLVLFAVNRGNNINPTQGKFSFIKIFRYGVLVRDFIPVLDWDMTPCMYDKVSGQLFYNQGTGSFVAGRQIHQVEYLESTGTQYIDTGVQYIQGDTIELNGRFVSPAHDDGLVVMQPWNLPDGSRFMFAVGNSGTFTSFTMSYNSLPGALNNPQPRYLDDQFHTWHYEGLTLTIDDGLVSLTNTENYNQGSGTLRLFYRFNGACATAIKYYKQWRDGELICDFIPIVDELGVGAMFDRVTHTIYDNAGTGAGFNYPPVEIEYLGSSGTQYIDTGILSKQSLKIKTKIDNTGASASEFAYGVRKDTATITCATGTYSGGVQTTGFFRWGTSAYSPSSPYGVSEIEQDSSGVMVNGNFYTYTGTQTVTSQTGYTITLFAGRNSTSGVTANLNGKIFYLKLWDNGTLVRDYIPCFKDGVAGMWDKVNSVFYPNAGTNAFVAGAVKEPEYE